MNQVVKHGRIPDAVTIRSATVPADAVLALVEKWRKDAERLDKSFGPGDMILACGKRADADELEALTRGEGNG